MVPLAVHLHQIPAVGTAARIAGHIDALQACRGAQHLIRPGIGITHARAVQQHTLRAGPGVGIVIVGVVDQPVMQHQRPLVFAHAGFDLLCNNLVDLAGDGLGIRLRAGGTRFHRAGFEHQRLPLAVPHRDPPEILARIPEHIGEGPFIAQAEFIVGPVPFIRCIKGPAPQRQVDQIGLGAALDAQLPVRRLPQEQIGHAAFHIAHVDIAIAGGLVALGQRSEHHTAGIACFFILRLHGEGHAQHHQRREQAQPSLHHQQPPASSPPDSWRKRCFHYTTRCKFLSTGQGKGMSMPPRAEKEKSPQPQCDCKAIHRVEVAGFEPAAFWSRTPVVSFKIITCCPIFLKLFASV